MCLFQFLTCIYFIDILYLYISKIGVENACYRVLVLKYLYLVYYSSMSCSTNSVHVCKSLIFSNNSSILLSFLTCLVSFLQSVATISFT